jgi:hypothetical protein
MKLYLHSAPSPWRNILSKGKGNVVSFEGHERKGGVEGQRHLFLVSALAEGEWLPLAIRPFYPAETAYGTHCGPHSRSGLPEQQQHLVPLPAHEPSSLHTKKKICN